MAQASSDVMAQTSTGSMDVNEFINQNKLSRLQWLIFICCFAITCFEGYDLAVIGYISPSLVAEWGLQKSDMSFVISIGIMGSAIGGIISGPISDRIGRKLILVVAMGLLGSAVLLSAWVTNLHQLEILRFIAGTGLGSAIPISVVLLSEYSPDRHRYLMVNTMFCGLAVGASAGGFISGYLIETFSWHATLLFGGVGPLLLGVVLLLFIPESPSFLLKKKGKSEKLKKVMARIHHSARQVSSFHFNRPEAVKEKRGPSVILANPYRFGTFLLWAGYFFGLIIYHGMLGWLPMLLGDLDFGHAAAASLTGLFALGGIGKVASGWFMDRVSPSLFLMGSALLAAVLISLIGPSTTQSYLVLSIVVFLAGLFITTAEGSLPSYASHFYPTSGRATGITWMMGVGRLGGFTGPFIIGYMVDLQFTLSHIFMVLSIPAVCLAVVFATMKWRYREL